MISSYRLAEALGYKNNNIQVYHFVQKYPDLFKGVSLHGRGDVPFTEEQAMAFILVSTKPAAVGLKLEILQKIKPGDIKDYNFRKMFAECEYNGK